MFPTEWKIVAASVVGFSHQETGAVCQDAHSISVLTDGWVIAAVSDGAGSAIRSADGARAISQGIVSHIASRLPQIIQDDHQLNEAAVRLVVAEGIELIRTEIVETANGESLDGFHATLVGVVAGTNGGVFFHIGDGAALATDSETFSSYILSNPENGEYANETFFFTQSIWQEHLRTTPFSNEFNLIALMSDGVTPFALAPGGKGPHPPFFRPVSKFLDNHSREEGERALAATLQSEAIRRITGDDKTLLWGLRVASND